MAEKPAEARPAIMAIKPTQRPPGIASWNVVNKLQKRTLLIAINCVAGKLLACVRCHVLGAWEQWSYL